MNRFRYLHENYNVPHRVRLQVQDWFTPWTDVE